MPSIAEAVKEIHGPQEAGLDGNEGFTLEMWHFQWKR